MTHACMTQTLFARRFGPPDRPVVGVLQRPPGGIEPRAAFLLARPMGMEATRTAAVYRVLSDRLARAGALVLRYDAHGCGDSPGEESAQSLSGWVHDAASAHQALRALHAEAPHLPTHWFGMGLGANVLLQAAPRVAQAPTSLVLWEPICDGPAYVAALQAAHRDELERQLAQPWPTLLARGWAQEPGLPGSVLGFDIGEQLSNDLLHLDPIEPWLPGLLQRGIQLTACLAPRDHPRLNAIRQVGERNGLSLHEVTEHTNWMSSQAMGSAIVPPDLPRILTALLT